MRSGVKGFNLLLLCRNTLLNKNEKNFVAIRHSEKIYIQVSENISEPATLERKLAPLRAIKDAYPKILLARTRNPSYDIDGIRIIDIADWLSE